jgi:glycine/D-amino acid oxidase-like deaminating enzyme/nitrite reductase/ring-hydroxylating ferredoxin subunit
MKSTLSPETVQRSSVWAATADMPTRLPLRENVRCDVCIVGGGIAGLSTAYQLTLARKSIVLVDDGSLAGGMTEVTTAHLASALDDRYFEIEEWHGREGARLAAESHREAIDWIEAIAKNERIDCDFQRLNGYLILAPGDTEEVLNRELDAARRAGLHDVVKVECAPIPTYHTGPCLRFPRQAQFHPLKYLAGLAGAVERRGGRMFTNTHADHVEGGVPVEVRCGGYTVVADALVVATNTPINDMFAVHTKQAAYMTYVIGARLPRGSLTTALYWDTARPFHYLRLQGASGGAGDGGAGNGAEQAHDLLIVGGEDHRSGQMGDAHQHQRLEAWARARLPMMQEIDFAWAGQVMQSVDGLAFIGRNPGDRDNVYIVTGDSGMGMTHGTIAGMLLTDLILGRENPWSTLYDPARKTLRAAGRFLKESLSTAVQYADWLTGGDVASTDEIPSGAGALVRRGMSKVAVYRDDQGRLHARSAVCPHLGCIVHWNGVERTWDCPCHGSRFDSLGGVINGPANQALEPLAES